MRSTRLRLATLALILTLSTLPAVAAERATRPAKSPSLFAWVLQTLERFVPALGEGRGGIDPDGGGGAPAAPAPQDENDGRWTIDPDGGDLNG